VAHAAVHRLVAAGRLSRLRGAPPYPGAFDVIGELSILPGRLIQRTTHGSRAAPVFEQPSVVGLSVNPGMAHRARGGRCGPPGRSGYRPALPRVDQAGPATDAPAGVSTDNGRPHSGHRVVNCFLPLKFGTVSWHRGPRLAHIESLAVTAGVTMVQHGEPRGGGSYFRVGAAAPDIGRYHRPRFRPDLAGGSPSPRVAPRAGTS
jgi:hypothetical protein